MALFSERKLRERASLRATNFSKSASRVLAEKVANQAEQTNFDIFLSHAFDDKHLLVGTLLALEELGYRVFVDWIDDPKLDRSKVTPATAAVLRERMRNSRCLLYAVTPSARDSAWMKWELGWKDGQDNRVAILPIEESRGDSWNGQQFLGLYPYITDGNSTDGTPSLWIHRTSSIYVRFDQWLNGAESYSH